MARRKADETEAEGEQVKASEVIKPIGPKKLRELLTAKRQAVEFTSETNGALGSKISDAVKNHNLHKGAFAWLARIDRMDPERARDHVDTFMHYLEVSGVGKRLESIQRLPLGEEEPAEAAE